MLVLISVCVFVCSRWLSVLVVVFVFRGWYCVLIMV